MSPIDLLNELGSQGSPIVVAILWQSTLLAIAVGLVCRLLPVSWPNVRYWLWQLVAVKLLLLPFWGWELAVLPMGMLPEQHTTNPVRDEVLNQRISGTPGRPIHDQLSHDSRMIATDSISIHRLRWEGSIAALWLAGVSAGLTRLLLARIRLGRVLGRTVPAQSDVVAAASRVSEKIGVREAWQVRLSHLHIGPFVCSWWRPQLILPYNLPLALEREQLDQVLAHELAHLKRRDLAWGWLPEIARLVYWFHPVAHWTLRQVRLERELACDQAAMTACGHSGPEYAETLLRVVSLFPFARQVSGTVGGLHGVAVRTQDGASNEARP